MNKHNVIELFDYKKNKEKVDQEHLCFGFLDSLKDRINMATLYGKNFKAYIESMVKDGHVRQSFADNLIKQVDFILEESLKCNENSKVKG